MLKVFGFCAFTVTALVIVPTAFATESYKTLATFLFFIILLVIKMLCGDDAADKYRDAVNKNSGEE